MVHPAKSVSAAKGRSIEAFIGYSPGFLMDPSKNYTRKQFETPLRRVPFLLISLGNSLSVGVSPRTHVATELYSDRR